MVVYFINFFYSMLLKKPLLIFETQVSQQTTNFRIETTSSIETSTSKMNYFQNGFYDYIGNTTTNMFKSDPELVF